MHVGWDFCCKGYMWVDWLSQVGGGGGRERWVNEMMLVEALCKVHYVVCAVV